MMNGARENADFANQYARACEERLAALEDKLLDLVEDVYKRQSEMFVNLLSVFANCRSAGLHIAVICHCRVETVNPPEGEAYKMCIRDSISLC